MHTLAKSPRVVLRLAEVKKATGLSRCTIYRKMSDGSFPLAVKLGKRAIGWYADEIDSFNRSCSRVSVGSSAAQ